ncbi:MAG: hypothetical protein ABEI78_00245, partial [Candidatus Nanohaloarchaea archaeon]
LKTVFEEKLLNHFNDTETTEVKIKDIQKPEINNILLLDSIININETINIDADLEDNEKIGNAKITIKRPNNTKTNITLIKSGLKWEGSFNKTTKEGTYKLTDIYVKDQADNQKHKKLDKSVIVSELKLKAKAFQTNSTVKDPVKFNLNITGNSSTINYVKINITTPSSQSKTKKYQVDKQITNVTFSNFTESANHSVKFIVQAKSKATDTTREIFIQYGKPSIKPLIGNQSTIYIPEDDSPVEIPFRINAINGDLIEVNATLNSKDTSVIEIQDTKKHLDNITFLEEYKKTNFTATLKNKEKAEIKLKIKAENGSTREETFTIDIIQQDTTNPKIREVKQPDNPGNLNETLYFTANITDNSIINRTILKIQYPGKNTFKTVKTFNQLKRHIYKLKFKNTSKTGTYKYKIKTIDTGNNIDTFQGSFNITDNLNIDLDTNKEIFIKNDQVQINLNITDASNEQLKNYNTTVILSKNGTNITLTKNKEAKQTSYIIKAEDPPSP